ncbi:M56 family metallopeptidase [Parasphingorhabdus halotolerans]|uniref:Peptidase M56 domain-containing protein n=1 Tax=Parasphingorhabdus halotolerans TaxID=2725558 RepID=A0A6H2DMI7_9SPHN|nr:M56 family metallopeptidase [Parasphingorhabdus halotolerans]QJB68876.1 hypothetical protein HF685_05945 [Parasphingorhabdus halotolerans]
MSAEIMGDGLGTWVWDTMLSMTLLMALVLLIRKPVAHFFGAKIAYLLWVLPLARLFMPGLTFTIAAPPESAETAGALAAPLAASDLGLISASEQAASGTFASVDWMMIAVIIWVGGAGMLFISKLASYFQFREDIVSDGQLVGRHGNIRILETAAVSGPLAFGLFQKYIAVPNDFFRNYAPRERELALDHEIAHHESGDLAANFIGLLVLSLHWCNPIAWFSWIAFRQDQETACDARILQQSGIEARAIYGRTIAKSVSGHKLGLASPLNQKNKIKDRIKMLGQSEKSVFRKRLGALMVGTSAVVVLPLTATVSYAVETAEHADHEHGNVPAHSAGTAVDVGDDGVLVTEKLDDGYKYTVSNERGEFEFESAHKLKKSEIDERLSRMVPSYSNMSLPKAPALSDQANLGGEGETVNITMLNGSKDFADDKQYVHRIKHDGRTIVLRTNKKLSDADVRDMVAEAEEARREAEADIRDHERDMREHQREMRMDMREVERDVEEAKREAARSVRDAMRESQWEVAQSVREAEQAARETQIEAAEAVKGNRASRKTSSVWSIANQISSISFAPRPPRAPSVPKPPVVSHVAQPDCEAMNKQIAFGGQKNVMSDRAWAVVAGCGTFKVEIDEKKLMKLTLRGLEKDRAEAAKCKSKDRHHAEKMRAYDRDIKKLRTQLSMT